MKQLIVIVLLLILCVAACKAPKTNPGIQSIKVSELAKLKVDNSNLVFLDVRTPKEIDMGKIDSNALELDFYEDNFEVELQKMDKSKTYVVYCRSGGRSAKATNKMNELGFTDIYNLEGGFNAWSNK